MEQRSQKRIIVAIPVHVRGKDAQGQMFDENTEACDLSRRGLSFLTLQELALYSSLSVVIPGRGPFRAGEGPTDFFAQAVVVSTRREEELNRVGIRFLGATLPVYSSES